MELLTILSGESEPDHTWCGNDQTGNFSWHDRLPRNPDRVSIRLSWKAGSNAPEQYIGTFALHIAALLNAHYIRSDSSEKVRVKFVNDQGVIRLAQGLRRPGIVVGIREAQQGREQRIPGDAINAAPDPWRSAWTRD